MSPVNPAQQPGLQIAQIFLRHAHFEHTSDPLTVHPHTVGEADIEISYATMELQKSTGGSASGIMLRANTSASNSHIYSFDVAVTAIVEPIDGEENYPLAEYAAVAGAALLFPFLREAVANITGRGRVGALWLKPFNLTIAGRVEAGETNSAQPARNSDEKRGKNKSHK
ncbi:MAG: Preprotein translocase subunit SecB [Gemmatimonadetes bacterium]|nr:Preprotein translocase subunit SecB [Gemmatimonadota bacterium]